MPFSLDCIVDGEVRVIIVHGYLDIESGKILRTKVESLLAKGTRKIIFDLSDVPLISSGSLGELIDIVSKTLSISDLKICFFGLTNTVRACFRSVGMTLYAQLAEDRSEALSIVRS